MNGYNIREPNLNRQSPSQNVPGNQPNQFAQPSLGPSQPEQLSISDQAAPLIGNQQAIFNESEILSIPVQPVSDNSNGQLDPIEQSSHYSLISGMQ